MTLVPYPELFCLALKEPFAEGDVTAIQQKLTQAYDGYSADFNNVNVAFKLQDTYFNSDTL